MRSRFVDLPPFAVALTTLEREVLWNGLLQWRGPARLTDDVAQTIGFAGAADFDAHADRLEEAVRAGAPLRWRDWRRVLVSAAIVLADDVHGAGVEWETVTGLHDDESLTALRGVQRRVLRAASAAAGSDDEDEAVGRRPDRR